MFRSIRRTECYDGSQEIILSAFDHACACRMLRLRREKGKSISHYIRSGRTAGSGHIQDLPVSGGDAPDVKLYAFREIHTREKAPVWF